eukprot:TRINITY_DN66852_c0_g1_i1.p1 TRINITY_DN66852_c0_g1~~TRINITY_DN66852_c0_g1_i1.p1  ORF type:complete len:339 (+),score=15.10 TRINITY_DN66852_c0_g1_i1:61-1077(+)
MISVVWLWMLLSIFLTSPLTASRVFTNAPTRTGACGWRDYQECMAQGREATWWDVWKRPRKLPTISAERCWWIGKPEKGVCVPDCGHSANQDPYGCEAPFCHLRAVAGSGSSSSSPSYTCNVFLTTEISSVADGVSFPGYVASSVLTPAGFKFDKLPCSRSGAQIVSDWYDKTYPEEGMSRYYLWMEFARLTFNLEQLGHYGCNSCTAYDTQSYGNTKHRENRVFNTMEATCRSQASCAERTFYAGGTKRYCHPCPDECSECAAWGDGRVYFKCVLKSESRTHVDGYECDEPKPRNTISSALKTRCLQKHFYIGSEQVASIDDFMRVQVPKWALRGPP